MKQNGKFAIVEHQVEKKGNHAAEAKYHRTRRLVAKPKPMRKPSRPTEDRPQRGSEGAGVTKTEPILSGRLPEAPYRSAGKLYFDWRQDSWFGSAWVVGPQGLLTAGHNIFDRTAWSTDIVFELQENDGRSAGTFEIDSVFAFKGWLEDESVRYDIVACRTREQIGVAPLDVRTGLEPNQGAYLQLGYPGEPTERFPFDGKRMWECLGGFLSGDQAQVLAATDLTRGASGGPWLVQEAKRHFVNGLTSEGDEFESSSPYFGAGVHDLVDKVN